MGKTLQKLEIKTLKVGVDLHKKDIKYSELDKKSVSENDFSTLIDESIAILDESGKPIIVYLKIPELPTVEMVRALQSIEFEIRRRTKGLVSRSRIFGYMPRETIRKDYCTSTALARENADAHKTICNFGGILSKYYKEYCPSIFEMHMGLSQEKILDDWKIQDTPFTSGIINKNSAIKYHLDAGNIKKVYSNMVCFKRDCEGGHLSVPEYDIGLDIANKSVLLFDGQSIVHGVTPFHLRSNNAYRYTIVYYTLQQMWLCKPITEEIARIRQRKYDRELTRYRRLIGEIKPEEDQVYKDLYDKHLKKA